MIRKKKKTNEIEEDEKKYTEKQLTFYERT